MEKQEQINEAARIIDHLERQMAVAGIIATELAQKGTKIVMVGGSAVELYTQANYMTRDIDFVATRPDGIKEVMTGLGFKNDGGTWYLPDNPNIVVEFPVGPLDGSWDKTLNVSLPNGNNVKVIGIEDIIIDRASAVKHWNDPEEWTNYLIAGNYERIDWNYLDKRAKELDCTEVIYKSREWAEVKRMAFIDEQTKQKLAQIHQSPDIKDLPRHPNAKDRFNAYAKEALQEAGNTWTDKTNQRIAEKMLTNGITTEQTISSLKCSPNPPDNARKFVNSVISNNPTIRNLLKARESNER